MTIIAGVVGNPVAYSLSPAIHNAWIAAARLDATYKSFFVEDEAAFRHFVTTAWSRGLRGVNVTVPFKEQALELANTKEHRAQLAGAANVLTFLGDRVRADNTDGIGLLAALGEQAPQLAFQSGPTVILGAGGAARGAAAALAEVAASVRVVNRNKARAQALAAELGPSIRAYGSYELRAALNDAVLIINATPLGLGGGQGPHLPVEWLPPAAVVMDMVYKPLRTEFIARAADAGHVTVDGLAMLIGQARPSFEMFFGQPPPSWVDVRAVALEAMR